MLLGIEFPIQGKLKIYLNFTPAHAHGGICVYEYSYCSCLKKLYEITFLELLTTAIHGIIKTLDYWKYPCGKNVINITGYVTASCVVASETFLLAKLPRN